jgi:hypothetical protein
MVHLLGSRNGLNFIVHFSNCVSYSIFLEVCVQQENLARRDYSSVSCKTRYQPTFSQFFNINSAMYELNEIYIKNRHTSVTQTKENLYVPLNIL